ncbi:hypothetical protein MMPV_001967 [Pyropia vietnamensis]
MTVMVVPADLEGEEMAGAASPDATLRGSTLDRWGERPHGRRRPRGRGRGGGRSRAVTAAAVVVTLGSLWVLAADGMGGEYRGGWRAWRDLRGGGSGRDPLGQGRDGGGEGLRGGGCAVAVRGEGVGVVVRTAWADTPARALPLRIAAAVSGGSSGGGADVWLPRAVTDRAAATQVGSGVFHGQAAATEVVTAAPAVADAGVGSPATPGHGPSAVVGRVPPLPSAAAAAVAMATTDTFRGVSFGLGGLPAMARAHTRLHTSMAAAAASAPLPVPRVPSEAAAGGASTAPTRVMNTRSGGSSTPLPPPITPAGRCYPAAGEGVHVFVLDTGCRPGHEQLHPRATVAAAPGSPYASGLDDFGHGTHVASIIAGRDLGIAPRSRVTCIKALSATNDGSSADVISAIRVVTAWAIAHPRSPVVMSVSLGVAASRWFTALDGAINGAYHAGVLPVISAGNAGRDACAFTPARAAHALTVAALDSGEGGEWLGWGATRPNGTSALAEGWKGGQGAAGAAVDIPAHVAGTAVVPLVPSSSAAATVAGALPAGSVPSLPLPSSATHSAPRLAPFSNRGRCVSLAAPGVDIWSAHNAADNAYAMASGTSMAAPHVSGLAALIWAENPAASVRAVRAALLAGSVPVGGGGESAPSACRGGGGGCVAAQPEGAVSRWLRDVVGW